MDGHRREPAAVTLSLARGGLLSGLLDRRTVAGRLIQPETNRGKHRHDNDHGEQQSGDI